MSAAKARRRGRGDVPDPSRGRRRRGDGRRRPPRPDRIRPLAPFRRGRPQRRGRDRAGGARTPRRRPARCAHARRRGIAGGARDHQAMRADEGRGALGARGLGHGDRDDQRGRERLRAEGRFDGQDPEDDPSDDRRELRATEQPPQLTLVSPMLPRRTQQSTAVAKAILDGTITAEFEPIADLATGRIVGVDARPRVATLPHRSYDTWLADAEAADFSSTWRWRRSERASRRCRSSPTTSSSSSR